MTLLDAHHAERFETVRDDTEVLSCRGEPPDDGIAVARRHGDLVGELTGEREAEQAPAQAVGERDRARAHVREGLVRDVLARCEHALQQLARARPRDRELRPLLRHRGELHIELRPQHLMTMLHVLVDRHRVGGGGGHEPVLLAEPCDRAVVHHTPVLAQHHAVARAADGERLPTVGVEALDEAQRVRTLELDLAERRHIAETDGRAHRLDLADDGWQPIRLARTREVLRTQPRPGFDEHRALLARPDMRRREPRRTEIRAAVMTGERTDGDGGVGRTIGGRADLADRPAGERRKRREAVERRGLALVGRHAERRVALGMLGRAETFAMREFEVVGRDIVLEVDEALAPGRGRTPQRGPRIRFVAGHGRRVAARRDAEAAQGILGCTEPRRQGRCGVETAAGGAGDEHAGRQPVRQEHRARLVPTRTRAEMRGEVQRRRPTARHGEQVAVETVDTAVGALDLDALQTATAEGAPHDTGQQGCIARDADGAAARVRPRIDQRDDLGARSAQIGDRRPGMVVVGEHDRAPAGPHGVAVDVGADRARQHHAREVVVAEHQRALERPGGEHAALRDDAPQSLARLEGGRHGDMVVDALDGGVGAVVVGRDHGGPRQQADIGHRGELGDHRLRPAMRRAIADGDPFAETAAAEQEVLLGEDHPRAAARGDQRRHQPGGARADDQQVAERRRLLVVVGVGEGGERPEPRSAPDRRLVDLLPELRGPHEGLVVEARAEQRREQPVHGEQVEAQRRPTVLALRLEAVVELGHRGAGVRLATRASAQFHQGVRLLGTGGQHAARAVILERASEQAHLVGEQRGGQRVAGVALMPAPVETEAQRAGAVDQAAAREARVHASPRA